MDVCAVVCGQNQWMTSKQPFSDKLVMYLTWICVEEENFFHDTLMVVDSWLLYASGVPLVTHTKTRSLIRKRGRPHFRMRWLALERADRVFVLDRASRPRFCSGDRVFVVD